MSLRREGVSFCHVFKPYLWKLHALCGMSRSS
nr:MAG TPA: hypothetical protein [Caudoviricetes sp.]